MKFAEKNGIISRTAIEQQIEMKKRETYLNMHHYKIWFAADGYWKTKLPRGKDGKYEKLLKKKNKEDLEDEIILFYEMSTPLNSFKDRYELWIERQMKCGRSDNTVDKYRSVYRRFFQGYPIENLDISLIDEDIISEHFVDILKSKDIRWKAVKEAFYNMNGVFVKAKRDRLIDENPCDYVDLPLLQNLCYVPPVKSAKERTLSEKEQINLIDRLQNPRALNSNIVVDFAIEMAMYTGMRVGELAGLMWEDIDYDEQVINIIHSEKMSRITKERVVTTTKNGKTRVFPLTSEITDLLDRINNYEEEKKCKGEFVFQDEKGRINKDMISASIRRKTNNKDFSNVKSIHTIRRTINSNLKGNGVSTLMASSLLGHTERVNNSNYTYDLQEMNLKREAVETATKIVTKKRQIVTNSK